MQEERFPLAGKNFAVKRQKIARMRDFFVLMKLFQKQTCPTTSNFSARGGAACRATGCFSQKNTSSEPFTMHSRRDAS